MSYYKYMDMINFKKKNDLKREKRKDIIKKRILKLYNIDKKRLAARTIMYSDRAFMGRAERLFGSWQKAVEYSGIDYDKIRKTEKWSKTRIIEEIKMRWKRGEPLNASTVKRDYNALICAGCKYFG
ncbi:MAG: hypothetical protein AB7T10_09875, partial [bacterium]